ncbi:hypothetical protein PanWU01x14_156130 [Parasponia andersonii]|uniref:Uncharacterized protein n=1 Tax=Parasponia andersonii TaxID=3476 RepID=A0A2P5CFW5_PARAD|nr:hypothetical protein PanWU01x14_156130 [Parasponia andersonii]
MELSHFHEVDISNDINYEDCKKPVKYKCHLATRYEKAEACLECIHVHICEPMEKGADATETRDKKFKNEVEHIDMDSLRDLLRPTLVDLTIPYEYATIYEHSHIATAEKHNIKLKHTIKLMYKKSLSSKRYWDYALKKALYILNFIPSDKVTSTLF